MLFLRQRGRGHNRACAASFQGRNVASRQSGLVVQQLQPRTWIKEFPEIQGKQIGGDDMSIRISREQAAKLGVSLPDSPRSRVKGMNRLESRFAAELAAWVNVGILQWYAYEAVKLRLAKKTWFTPDFVGQKVGEPFLTFWETKGWMRDDANVKIKVASETYRHFKFVVVRWVGGTWEYQEIEP